MISPADGHANEVEWPAGHAVRDDGAQSVLVDGSGAVVAREGDLVNLTGGVSVDRPNVFDVCAIAIGPPPVS